MARRSRYSSSRARPAPATTSAGPSDEPRPRERRVSNLSLMPVPSEQSAATCANCGAALVADQRYCLTCGQPCSPVRLAFLDVLTDPGHGGGQAPPAWGVPNTIDMGSAGFLPVARD